MVRGLGYEKITCVIDYCIKIVHVFIMIFDQEPNAFIRKDPALLKFGISLFLHANFSEVKSVLHLGDVQLLPRSSWRRWVTTAAPGHTMVAMSPLTTAVQVTGTGVKGRPRRLFVTSSAAVMNTRELLPLCCAHWDRD